MTFFQLRQTRLLWLILLLFVVNGTSLQVRAEERAPASTTEAIPQGEKSEGEAVEWGITYKADFVRGFKGGENRGGYLGNLDLTLLLNMEELVGARGLSLFVYGLGNHGDKPSEFIGDSFVASNIEAPNTFKIYELYLKQRLNDNFSVLLGWRDLNADFYSTDSSSGFINSAFGISPALAQTGQNGPSIFPSTSLAFTARYENKSSYFQAGVFNAVAGDPEEPMGTHLNTDFSDGTLVIMEAGLLPEAGGPGKYSLGVWDYSKESERLDPDQDLDRNQGAYILLDHSVSEDVSVFLRYGWADPDMNQFSSAGEVGFQWKGPLEACPDDHLSVGWARGQASSEQRRLNDSADFESVFEFAYTRQLDSHLSLTPDFQWILNPGLDPDSDPAQVLGLRLKLQY